MIIGPNFMDFVGVFLMTQFHGVLLLSLNIIKSIIFVDIVLLLYNFFLQTVSATVGFFIGFTLGILILVLSGAVFLWLYGSFWTTTLFVFLGGGVSSIFLRVLIIWFLNSSLLELKNFLFFIFYYLRILYLRFGICLEP